jgi:hypothetical protein
VDAFFSTESNCFDDESHPGVIGEAALLLRLLFSARVAECRTGILGTVSVLFSAELTDEDMLSTDAIDEVELDLFS